MPLPKSGIYIKWRKYNDKQKNVIILICIVVIIALLSIFSCYLYIKSNYDRISTISFEQYSDNFKKMNKDLKIEGFELVSSTINAPILVTTDLENSFGTRQFLTVSGYQSDKGTQSRIEYANKDKNQFISIDSVYLKRPLAKDLAYVDVPILGNDIANLQQNKQEEYILTYKNTMVIVKIHSKIEDANIRSNMIKTIKSITKFIEKTY